MLRSTVGVLVLCVLSSCEEGGSKPRPAADAGKPGVAATPTVRKPVEDPPSLAAAGRYLAVQQDVVAEVRKRVVAAKGAAQADAGARLEERRSWIREATDAAISKLGVAREEYDRSAEVFAAVSAERKPYDQIGGEAGLRQLAGRMKQDLGDLTGPEGEQAGLDAMALTTRLREAGNATEARKKYGDGMVDAVLKHSFELASLRNQLEALERM